MTGLRFDLRDPPPGAAALRAEVRAFIAEQEHRWTPEVRARSWMGFDRDFTRAVGAKGWIGMCWPKQYGGGERSFLDRNIVLEEMLAAGAPVGAHWIGDRQSGPLILRLGTEAQRQNFLPNIVTRRTRLLHRAVGARFRIGPGLPAHAGRPHGRWLGAERPQNLDDLRPPV